MQHIILHINSIYVEAGENMTGRHKGQKGGVDREVMCGEEEEERGDRRRHQEEKGGPTLKL